MGQFSWITSDTDKSILADGHQSVKMLSPDGRVFHEDNYEGYGVFGGKDYFELLAELNVSEDERELAVKKAKASHIVLRYTHPFNPIDVVRKLGIDLLYQGENRHGDPDVAEAEYGIKLPKLVSASASDIWSNYPQSQTCPNQGWSDHAEEDDRCGDCGELAEYCYCDDE